MTLSGNYSNKLAIILILSLFFLPNFANSQGFGKGNLVIKDGRIRIAVFPLENLSGTVAPLKEIRQMFVEKLRAIGIDVLDEESLEKFMAKHRIRYTGGIDGSTAQAFKREADTDRVLLTSLELYSDSSPPKISLISRLVSTGDNPSILWIDGVGLAGDDSPGFLNMGLIEDPKVLLDKAMKRMFDSLNRYISSEPDEKKEHDAKGKFRPRIFYRSPVLDPVEKYTVAITPFVNLSGRKYAGDMMVLHLAKELKKFKNFNVIEFGIVRQAFLELRIVMDQGISLANADSVLALLDADLIVSGTVTDYDDYQGMSGKPKVGFTTQLIAKKGREVVWSSDSYNEGDDGVFFFDVGRVNTAYTMASQMAQWIGKMMVK